MLTRQQKETIVAELTDAIRDKTALFVDYRGVNTAGMLALRRKLKEQGSALRVVRKTLFQRALSAIGIETPPKDLLEGQVAVAYGFSDVSGAAKAIRTFKRELEAKMGGDVAFTIRGGYLEGIMLTAQQVETLALLPSRQELLATLARTLAAPLSGIVSVLSGPQRQLVYVLHAKSKVEQSS